MTILHKKNLKQRICIYCSAQKNKIVFTILGRKCTKNAFAAGVPPRTPLWELLQTPYMDFGSRFMAGNGREREGRGRREVRGQESRGMEGKKWEKGEAKKGKEVT